MFSRIRNFIKRSNRAKSKISRAIKQSSSFLKETKDQVVKIRDLKNRISSLEREAKEAQQNERIFKNIEAETAEAKRIKRSELEWANNLEDGDFSREIIPESVLEKLEQKNENWDGSEMVTTKREILLEATKEDVEQQDPFKENRQSLRQKKKPKQQPAYSVEDDEIDIDNIPF